MPLYEYLCEACGSRFEVIQKFSDPYADTCKKCGKGPVQRQFSSPAIHFKGSGWYITDYAQKGKPAGETSGGDAGETKADKADKKETTADKKDQGDTKTPAAGSESTATKTDTKASAAATPAASGSSS